MRTDQVVERARDVGHARLGTQRHQRTRQFADPEPVPIIAFSKDWNGEVTSNHHVLRELAKTRRVVWLNVASSSAPSLKTLRQRLLDVVRGPVRVENDLWVATPLAIPLPERPVVRAVDRWLVEGFVRAVRTRLGIDRFQLWSFLPNVAEYLGMGEELAVYYCSDEWSMFDDVDRAAIAAHEQELLGRVDAVFAVNHALADAKRERNASTFVAPHGVDHALFASALDPEIVVPAELAALPRPRIGFFGALREWVDVRLLAEIARARPAWSIVLIGDPLTDLVELAKLPNVHLLGARAHAELPAYCAGFDVGLIPYRRSDRMEYVNPLKLREYLAAGLAVVSTPITEAERYPGSCEIATDAAGFIAAIERVLATDSRAARRARSAVMVNETWQSRVECISHRVDEVADRASSAQLEHQLLDPLA